MGKLISVALSLLLSFSARANSDDCENLKLELEPIFTQSFEDIYRPLMCSGNIKKLIERLQQNNISIEHAQVLHVRALGAPYVGVSPLAARTEFAGRSYNEPVWAFHAVLIVNGLVFDFDYRNELEITGFNEYFATMWNEQKNLVFQIKPASLYGGRDLYGKFYDREYADIEEFSQLSDQIQNQLNGLCVDYGG